MQGNPPPFHALARGIREVIEEQAKTAATQTLLAGFLDGYISQTAGPCTQVPGLYGETMPTIGSFVLVGPRGSGKSPMGAYSRQHFDTWHDNYIAGTAGAWQEYQGKLEVWKAEKAGILKTVKKHAAAGLETDANLQQRLIDLQKDPPQPPPSPSERFEDTTITPWIASAVRHPATFFCADEGGPILESMDKDLIGALCGGWSEVPPSRARSHTGVQVVRVMPTVVLSVQNDVWLNFQSKPKGRLFMEIGMGSRPLYYVVHQSDFVLQSADVSDEPENIALPRFLDRAAHFLGVQDQLNQRGWTDRKLLELSQPAKREARDVCGQILSGVDLLDPLSPGRDARAGGVEGFPVGPARSNACDAVVKIGFLNPREMNDFAFAISIPIATESLEPEPFELGGGVRQIFTYVVQRAESLTIHFPEARARSILCFLRKELRVIEDRSLKQKMLESGSL